MHALMSDGDKNEINKKKSPVLKRCEIILGQLK